jgi:hypothetical protein
MTAQRRGRDCAVAIITQSEMGIFKVFWIMTTSAIHCLFGALGGDGTVEVDPSGTSAKSRPGYSPISGWGG